MTAKFTPGKVFHFMVNNGWLEWWDGIDDSFFQIFKREDLGYGYEYVIKSFGNTGCISVSPYWVASVGDQVLGGQDGEFFMDRNIYDKYPNNTTFTYNYAPKGSLEYTITVVSRSWINHRWQLSFDGYVGFDAGDLDFEKTIKARYGETVTVYAEGNSGYHSFPNDTEPWSYNVMGFYNSVHVSFKDNPKNSNTGSYTFTVYGNNTIYVDFQYFSR